MSPTGQTEEADEFQEIDRTPAGGRAVSRTTSRYRDRGPRKTGFGWRMLAGFLGAVLVVLVVDTIWGEPLRALWAQATEGLEHTWFQFTVMGLVLFAIALVCGLVTAFMESSAVRGFFLGAGWCAIVVLIVTAVRSANPEGLDNMPIGFRLAEAALNPAYVHKASQYQEQKALAEQTKEELSEKLSSQEQAAEEARQKVEELTGKVSELRERLTREVAEAEERGKEEKAAELQTVIDETNQSLEAANKELEETKSALEQATARINELEGNLKTLSKERNEKAAEARDLQEALEKAEKRVEELEAVLNPDEKES